MRRSNRWRGRRWRRRGMRTFYSTSQGLALPPGHRFPMGKYAALRDRLSAECPGLRLAQAPPASDAELALAHAPAYVAAVVQGRLDARAQREIGFPWSEAMVERSRRSVGASIQATRVAQHE